MSIAAMAWAWQQPVKGSDKLVLLALADHSDDDGVCWPGKRGIAEKCGLSRPTVIAAVGRLAEAGLLRTEERFREDGSRSSDRVQLLTPPSNGFTTPVKRLDEGGQTALRRTEPSSESLTESNTAMSNGREAFDRWRDRCGHPKAKFDAKRRSAIRGRFRDGFTLDDAFKAIEGAARAAYVDERGKRHDEFELIFRNAAKMESFISRADSPSTSAAVRRLSVVANPAKERMDAWKHGYEESA